MAKAPTLEQLKAEHKLDFIPIGDILSDDAFNCRTEITYMDVTNLAQKIEKHGLLSALTVQPACDVKDRVMPPDKLWRIIAGHRRFKSLEILGYTLVPCIIKVGLSELEARILNISENLDRKDLNILEESNAIEALYRAGEPREKVAKMLGKSSAWVQVRYQLLELPEDIQQEAAAGVLSQFQLKELYQYRKDHGKMYMAVRKIKDAVAKGEKPPKVGKKAILQPGNFKKSRTQTELLALMEHIQKQIGNGIHTRILAWGTGNVTDDEIHEDLRQFASKCGKQYFAPTLEPV